MRILLLILTLLPSFVLAQDVKINEWVAVGAQIKLSDKSVTDLLSFYGIVLVGNVHNQLTHRDLQLDVLKRLQTQDKSLVFAMEAFTWEDQQLLDDWQNYNYKLSTEEFITEVNKVDPWGFDFALIRPVMEYARSHNIKIVGMRAPKKLLKEIKEKENFTEHGLVPPQLSRGYYDFLWQTFGAGNAHAKLNFTDFVKNQILWDATFAQKIEEYASDDTIVVASAGVFHVMFDWGIASSLTQTNQNDTLSILPIAEQFATTDLMSDFADVAVRTK